MMTTSYPHNPGMPPQGMAHGHPMAGPGGPNPGQQMHPGMHPGVSGPNGPVSQAGPMMGMQPGMGAPNAHAMSHLQPQQHMFAQQQQHPGMMNPQMIQQQRNAQQQAYMRQQQQAAMLAQQGGGGGMGMGFQNPMQNMSPQQIAAMRQQMGQGGFVNLPPHLQLQQQQQQMQSQQQGGPQHQAALMQAQAAAHHQNQQQHMAQQQAQAQAQAQAIAMQHANSQQSNHSHNANQGPPTTSQPQQGPLRPPSAMSHQGHTSPVPPPTPQQPPPQQQQPPPQQQQPQQSGPQPGQQTPAPAQPPSLPQQPNQQPQNPAQAQQRNPAMAQQAQAQAQAQVVQAQAAQAAQARNMAMMKQSQAAPMGNGTLKLMNFVDQLSKFTADQNANNVERWQSFIDKFFTDTGSFIHCLYNSGSDRGKQFEIVYAALPRYFYTLFTTDVTNLQITLDGSTEKASPTELKVTCDRAKFIYTYKNQCQVVYTGKLTAFWSSSDRMEWLQFEGQGYQQYIPRSVLEQLFHQPSPNQMNPNQSPRLNKNAKQKLQQQRAAEPPEPYLPMSKLPSAGVTDLGLPPVLQSYLEIYETMNNMTSLMAHYLEHPDLNTVDALDSWNTMMSTSNPTPMGQQNPGQQNPGQMPNQPHQMQQPNMPPGVRPQGPGQQGHMFMSPAMQNSLLPPNGMTGSPGMMHTPSPNGHPMVKQQSTSSHTASVNTSPNMPNKRRRSMAKMDMDDGDHMNGVNVKVKQSPRPGGGKRMKGGN
ncbi:hypothetical protein CC86DRAFT_391742 [Ophiobolus disseminans]|uniref:LIM-domain binding protein-domain-containing protein n=1 Tax=Ophiobolus disseminans TaxID=1469910 RepID=A0A6A7A8J1_9PLEO|nr:hypothetical protein CC86DRAFT_391742 [Ophiobolus disseminans]